MNVLRTGGKECFSDLPLAVNWILTTQCNYRCSYCFHYGEGKKPPVVRPFSTLSQLKTAVDNIASLNRPWYDVTLSGGEPTIHPHIFDLIAMLHEKLGERLNRILIITNGSRNVKLYENISELAKSVDIRMNISLHTDHVDMEHILGLIENLSGDINMNFSLMFNPAKRETVHEIYDTMFECRKKFWFNMSVVTLRDGDRIDPRYTPEDFAWQKKTIKQFKELVTGIQKNFPARKKLKHSLQVIHDIKNGDKIETVKAKNRALELAEGLLKFGGMFCIAHAALLRIDEDGRCKGMVCNADRPICNIYEENALASVRDKLIHVVKCNKGVCGCSSNDRIPKFASEEDAKNFVGFAQKRQSELFEEYDAAHSVKTLYPLVKGDNL